jgi:hypothetical protein
MTTAIKRRRGTTAQHATFTGLEAELTVDTDKKTVVVHDGSTAGGTPLAKAADTVNLTGAQTVAGVKTLSSNPVLDAGTANGVSFLNASKVLTTGSALTFDGTNIQIGKDVSGAVTNSISLGNSGIGGGIVTSTLFLARYGDNYGAYIQAIENYSANVAPPLIFGVAGSEQMRLTSTGLGIGTSSPTTKIDARLSGTSSGTVINVGNTGTGIFGGVGVSDGGAYPVELWGSALSFKTGSSTYASATEKMRLDSSGNLGIGTSSPGAKLEVLLTSTTDSSLRLRYNSSSIYGNHLMNGGGDYVIESPASNGVTSGNFRLRAGSTFSVSTNNNAATSPQLTLDSSGNLGLGVTPSASTSNYRTLEIGGGGVRYGIFGQRVLGSAENFMGWNAYGGSNTTGYGTGFYYKNSGDGATMYSQTGFHSWFVAPSGTAGNAISFSQVMTLDASGNLGLGTTSPSSSFGFSRVLELAGTTAALVLNPSNTTSGAGIEVKGASPLRFTTDNTERARIDSSGNLLVGTTSDQGAKVAADASSGNAVWARTAAASSAVNITWNSATSGDNIFETFFTDGGPSNRGSITYNRTAGLVAYNTTSDHRAKDITGPVIDSGALIDSVPVYMGKMKGATQERPMFIAHETPAYAHTGIKDAVDADGKPVYQQMDASALIPVMWAEIQSLRARLAAANI